MSIEEDFQYLDNEGKEYTYMPSNNSKALQRRILLNALMQNPINTIEAREYLGIMHPAGRVKELRDQGFNIISVPNRVTHCGTERIIALYILRPHQHE